jgi:hypothetical protein
MEDASAAKGNGDFTSQFPAAGELFGQGSHLIDLARWFLGKSTGVCAMLRTFFWSADVETIALSRLEHPAGRSRFFACNLDRVEEPVHISDLWTRRKARNRRLGRSYGVEKMLPQMGPPETTRWARLTTADQPLVA